MDNLTRWYAFTLHNDWEEKILIQCYCKVLNVSSAEWRDLGAIILVQLSKPQYLELNTMYKHYCNQWANELQHLWLAFINVNDLFSESTPELPMPEDDLLEDMIQRVGNRI